MPQHAPQIRIPATYMRGGTSKGVFFSLTDLPPAAQQPGPARDQLLLRVIGSPDPYGKHTDGMGGATSSTSKTVILSRSSRPEHDVDYLFGQVSIDKPFIDWSGNCGNLTAAVGAFAISNGLVDKTRIPDDGICTVRIWQANIEKPLLRTCPSRKAQCRKPATSSWMALPSPLRKCRSNSWIQPTAKALFSPRAIWWTSWRFLVWGCWPRH